MTTYRIDAPNGKTYQIDGPVDASQEQVQQEVLKQHPEAGSLATPTQPPQSAVMDTLKNIVSAVARPLAQGAIGAISFIPDVATAMTNLLPGKKDELPSSFWNRQLDRVTRAPGTTMGKIAEAGSSFVAGGAIGGMASGAQDAVKVTRRGLRYLEDAVEPKLNRVTTKAAEDAHLSGYSISPSYIGGRVRKDMQTIAGGPKVNKVISEGNQPVTDRLAKVSIDLHPDEELNAESIKTLKDEAYHSYEAVRALGIMPPDQLFDEAVKNAGGRFAERGKSYGGGYRFASIAVEKRPYLDTLRVDAGETLDEIRALRHASRANLRVYNPEANALGYTQREISNAMEDRIERYATQSGHKHILAALKAARAQLAKISAVEDSMGAGNHVNALDLARMLDKGVPLTDGLLTIAQTAKHFPKSMQFIPKEGSTGDFSAVDYMLGGSGIIYGHPAIAGLSMARPITRAVLQSEGAQSAMIKDLRKSPGALRRAAHAVVPETRKVVSGAGRAAARGAAIMTPENLYPDFGNNGP